MNHIRPTEPVDEPHGVRLLKQLDSHNVELQLNVTVRNALHIADTIQATLEHYAQQLTDSYADYMIDVSIDIEKISHVKLDNQPF